MFHCPGLCGFKCDTLTEGIDGLCSVCWSKTKGLPMVETDKFIASIALASEQRIEMLWLQRQVPA